jgi:hypothetical protein
MRTLILINKSNHVNGFCAKVELLCLRLFLIKTRAALITLRVEQKTGVSFEFKFFFPIHFLVKILQKATAIIRIFSIIDIWTYKIIGEYFRLLYWKLFFTFILVCPILHHIKCFFKF